MMSVCRARTLGNRGCYLAFDRALSSAEVLTSSQRLNMPESVICDYFNPCHVQVSNSHSQQIKLDRY